MYKLKLFVIFYLAFSSVAAGQISLINPSFEGEPKDATTPVGWFECTQTTTPDILPGPWGVYQQPAHGSTYVGLITRPDGTYESISQRLDDTLMANACYYFDLSLAQSETYAGFNENIGLKVWIGNTKCARDQLIFQAKKVDNRKWEKHRVEFIPKRDAQYIIIEAFAPQSSNAKSGNVLVDDISHIWPCSRV